MKIVDKHVPLKKLSRKEIKFLSKPWITKAIKKSICIKNNLYKKYIRTRNNCVFEKFKTYRNKLKHLIFQSKKEYYKQYFNSNFNDMKATWKGIREIVSLKPSKSTTPTKIIANDSVITDPKSIANAFNQYFTNIGSSLQSEIQATPKSFSCFLTNRQANSLYIFPVTRSEIELEISKLNIKKSAGLSSIPIRVLKCLSNLISTPLELLYNFSISTGAVLDKFKVAEVIPVFKKGSLFALSNYRPISLLPIFNQILERLICKRLTNFPETNNVFFNNQFGFRATKHCTTHAVLNIVDKIQHAIDSGNFSCGLFLDLSKAFDTVNHQILLNMLEHYGIRGIALDWFKSFLTNRKQFTQIGSTSSTSKEITCEVSQGSVLGPVLFLLYINDFHNSSTVFNFNIFADDSNLFYTNDSLTNLEKTVNFELSKIYSWLCANKLSLNIDKNEFRFISSTSEKNNAYSKSTY